MRRANVFLFGTVFLSFLLLAFPVHPQGNIPGDPWGFIAEDIEDGTWAFADGDTTYDPDDQPETFGTYTVTADGHDIWNPQDAFRFLYLEAEGDFSISVCILESPFQGGDNEWTKAGVMVRQNNSAGSADVYQVVTRNTPDTHFCGFQWRLTQGAGAQWRRAEPTATQFYPFWVRLRREGDTFYGDYSDDGETWVHPSGDTAEQVVVMEDPVLVGICLTSHQDGTLTTTRFTDFRFNGLGPQPRATALVEPDDVIYAGEEVTLNGSYSLLATDYLWEQVKVGDEPDVVIPEPRPSDGITTVTPPARSIGYVATFRLTVEGVSLEGQPGTDTTEVQVIVRAVNPPQIPPGNLRTYPMDVEGNLGFRLEWDPLIDADKYGVGEEIVEGFYFWYWIPNTHYEFSGMSEGQQLTVAVKSWNEVPGGGGGEGPMTQEVTYTALRNLALANGASPPSQYVYTFSSGDISTMNNGIYDESNDSQSVQAKREDFWGYLWNKPRFFDHIVYYAGQFSANGGWFTSLKVQYTQDGSTWKDVPVVKMSPEYSFDDSSRGRENFARYDITIPTVRGRGIRVYGTPGGMSTYTSIGELEVFGNGTRPADALIVQGIDAEVPEGTTATLDGSYSFSLAGPIVSWEWSGPLTIQNPNSPTASFDAPIVDSDEVFVFSLTASDGVKTDTDDDVRITVKNLKTTALAGPDQTVPDGSEVTLDGSASLTTTGNLTYLWTQTGGTTVGATGTTTKTVTFTAPAIWDYTEELTFQLNVNDGAGGTSSDEVVVTVRNALTWPAYPLTQAPNTYYFQDMLHLGQYPTDRLLNPHDWGNMPSGFDPLDPFGGAPHINPYPGLAYDFSGTTVTPTRNPMVWTPDHADNGMFLWSGRAGQDLSEFQSYYHIYIISPEDRDVRWHRRHDDEVRGWNNGVLIFTDNSWDNDAERTQDGFAADGTGLNKGLNSLTFGYEEGGGGNWIAVGVTDEWDEPFGDLYYSFGPAILLADAYAARDLPISYEPGTAVNVELSVRVNPDNKPGSMIISETIPPGLTEADVVAPGAQVISGAIKWTLTGAQVQTGAISYSLNIPPGTTGSLVFEGTVSFGTDSEGIFGDELVYGVPSAPRNVEVEMLVAAHLSWSAPPEEGVARYRIERSVDGGAWQEIATLTGTSYVDMSVVPGKNYSYRVSASNVRAIEGPACPPTEQAALPTMEIRQAEDFNYGGGLGPWTPDVTTPAEMAPNSTDLDAQYDYYFADTAQGSNTYRPIDVQDIRNIGTGKQPQWIMGYNGSGGNWWRYNINVPTAGWVKIVLKVAAPSPGTVELYWDEQLVGSIVGFQTAGWTTFVWFPLEEPFDSPAGVHVLRVYHASGNLDIDTIALGFDWTPPRRQTIWEDDFEDYSSTDDVVNNGGWTINNNSQVPEAAWQLWNTAGPPLNGMPADIAGMTENYVITDSDMAQTADMDEELISPEIDATGWKKLRLNFSKNYKIYVDPEDQQIAEVDIRVFQQATGWGDWVGIFHLDTTSVPSGDELSGPEQIDLSAYDGRTIQLRFHFYDATYDYWFAVDDIMVSGEPAIMPPPRITGMSKVGNQVSLTWEAFGDGQYTVQWTEDLVSAAWENVTGTWPSTETSWAGEDIAGIGKRYYRVMSASK